jgi:tetratricopeptide (TPR) repeat protein
VETADRWPRIKEIVGAALEKEPSERGAYLDRACSEDGALRREIDSLLAAYELAGGLSGAPWEIDPVEQATPSQIIGRYRLLRELGVGGMGQVWLAEQISPVSRQCALKLIKSGIYDANAVRRFEAERQSLALMDHPAIAKVFDAGTTPSGQPYFAMEYVDGLPINEYCDRKRMGIRERLTLFMQVCEGVQHAHQKAIIHRDIKPSNILVVEIDGKPCPRIIDFGLAKAVEPARDGETFFTQLGALLGTPGYMSPEQADPSVRDVDTRTDVYSLGVVLYELLTGVLPFNSARFKKQHLDEMLRELREDTPQRPSSNVNMHRETLARRAADRATDAVTLAGLLRGDLDWITMKALEKDRDRRFGTPTELASDIRRYLNDLPVLAGKGDAGYRLRKYLRRHRVAVALGAIAAVLVAAFSIVQAIQLRRLTRERDRADRITDFMTNMFKVPDPNEARGNAVTAREILDTSSKQIEAGLGQDAEVQSQLMGVMAETYLNLGLYSRAHELATLSWQNRQRTLGPNHPKTLESMTQMALTLYHEGHDRDAEQLIRSAIDLQQRQLGAENALTLQSRDDLAIFLEREGRYAEAEKLEREVVSVQSRKFGPEDPQTLRSVNNLASALKGESRFDEAQKEFRELLTTQRRVLGASHPSTIATMHNLANSLQEQGRYEEAEALYRETLSTSENVLGSEHPDTASTMITLANCINHNDTRRAEAEDLYRKALEIALRVAGPENSDTTRAEEGLANLLSSEGHNAEAEKLLRNVLAIRQRLLGPDHTDTLITQYNLATVLFHEGHLVEAEKLIHETFNLQTRVLGPEDPDTLASMAFEAKIMLSQKRPQEAEVLAHKAFDIQLRVLGPQHEDTLNSLFFRGHALVDLHRYPDADQLYRDNLGQIAAIKGDTSSAWYDFARIAACAGHRDEAFDYLARSIKAGNNDVASMRTDTEFRSLRSDPRFAQALKEAQKTRPARVS